MAVAGGAVGVGAGPGSGTVVSPGPNQSQPQITHVAAPPSMLTQAW